MNTDDWGYIGADDVYEGSEDDDFEGDDFEGDDFEGDDFEGDDFEGDDFEGDDFEGDGDLLDDAEPDEVIGIASWGTLGADHRVQADVRWSGDANVFVPPMLGWNPFKKISRGIKAAVRNPVKFARRGVQNVAHTATTAGRTVAYAAKKSAPYLAAGAVGVSLVCPIAAPLALSVAAGAAVLAKADKKIPKIPATASAKVKRAAVKAIKQKRAAVKVIKATVAKAKRGDRQAKRAVKVLKAVKKARNKHARKRVAFTVSKKGFALRVK